MSSDRGAGHRQLSGALAALFSVAPALAADMDANAKTLVKLDDDWSKAAATRDADRVASFHAEDAIPLSAE